MVAQEFLCITQNGVSVSYDPIDSHAATHFDDTPQLKELVIEVLTTSTLVADREAFDIDLGRVVGTTDVVTVDTSDEIVYAVRKNRDDNEYVPFTKSRPAEPSSWVTVSLDKQPDGHYILFSAWIGRYDDPPFPGTEYETPESRPYWTEHAFVWGSQVIKPGTETTTCPW
ncbi:MAG: hypothetical protein JWN38_596 [Candidatus Saccharibacteria bacterium]|nr:hypothetical protein [Candidatus Saccharibacteria bacterium]